MFKDKVAVITGSARGIGRAIAERLAEYKCNVVIADLNQDKCSQTALEIQNKYQVQTTGIVCDVSKIKSCMELVDKTISKFSKIDIWVNNAGVLRDNLIKKMSEEDWDLVLNTNLKGVFNGIQAVSKFMIEAQKGKIINMASISGLIGIAGQANYSSSKAGVIAITKTAAKELASKNITVNAIAPGFILTEMTAELPEKVQESLERLIPLPIKGRPKDIANGVKFLASDDADFITGVTLKIDGGMTIGF